MNHKRDGKNSYYDIRLLEAVVQTYANNDLFLSRNYCRKVYTKKLEKELPYI